MRGPRAQREYKERRERLERAVADHEAAMTIIAARGGKTLSQLRDMPQKEKEYFIERHRGG